MVVPLEGFVLGQPLLISSCIEVPYILFDFGDKALEIRKDEHFRIAGGLIKISTDILPTRVKSIILIRNVREATWDSVFSVKLLTSLVCFIVALTSPLRIDQPDVDWVRSVSN